MEKKILLFHVEKEKRQQIEILCASQGIVPVAVERKQYGNPLGSLVGIPGLKKRGKGYRGPELPGEMLVFFGLDSDALDLFLDGYRQAGIAPIPIKGVMTPYNMVWSAEQLFKELSEEHKKMQG